jgi:hypothetical protein
VRDNSIKTFHATTIPGSIYSISIACPTGKKVIAGGGDWFPDDLLVDRLVLMGSAPNVTFNSWVVTFTNPTSASIDVTGTMIGYVICANAT